MKYFVEVTKQGTYWYKDAEMKILHRVDGPAVEYANGAKYWCLNGVHLTEEEHRQQTQPAIEMTVADIEKLLGKKIKIVK